MARGASRMRTGTFRGKNTRRRMFGFKTPAWHVVFLDSRQSSSANGFLMSPSQNKIAFECNQEKPRRDPQLIVFCFSLTTKQFIMTRRLHSLSLFVLAALIILDGSDGSVVPEGSTLSGTSKKRLSLESMSPNLKHMDYAVRGTVVIAADKINKELKSTSSKYPFDKIIYTNIGNPHSLGQKPLTWPRQVLALVDLPDAVGIDHPDALRLFPACAIRRAREIKRALGPGGTGAYSHSQGARIFREDIARFIEDRDGGVPCDPDNIFITNGASSAIGYALQALIANEKCGTMIPIPQYPIYSASLDLLGGNKVGYFLNEEGGWDCTLEDLERTLEDAQARGINVNSFVMINPGNPTGQVLSPSSVRDIVRFCAKHNLVLLADEVYQENVYDDDATFYSAKRAAFDTGLLDNDEIELFSFHSTSKGVFGECGRRGGYMELTGIHPEIHNQLYKLASASLCSTLSGQVMTSLMVRGPDKTDESYESHEKEKSEIFESLKRRALIAEDGLNSIDGFRCQRAQGAMYCFPRVEMPAGALLEASRRGVTPDTLYALSLLDRTGICVIPASGFGQEDGRYGFRTTFLPSEDEMTRVVELMRIHHNEFLRKYS